MKYLIALLLGVVAGVALFVVALIYNPLVDDRGLSPLSVTDAEVIALSFDRVASENIILTNNGEAQERPYPEKVLQLWEAPIRKTTAMATVMRDARGQTAGIGIKFSSHSEETRLLEGKALVDSVWYVYLPGRGSLFVRQNENYWPLLTEVAFPAYRSAADKWKGTWNGDVTAGPGALGTAAVTGGSGVLEGLSTIGVESLTVRAYSIDEGLVAAEGRMLIEIPDADDELQ